MAVRGSYCCSITIAITMHARHHRPGCWWWGRNQPQPTCSSSWLVAGACRVAAGCSKKILVGGVGGRRAGGARERRIIVPPPPPPQKKICRQLPTAKTSEITPGIFTNAFNSQINVSTLITECAQYKNGRLKRKVRVAFGWGTRGGAGVGKKAARMIRWPRRLCVVLNRPPPAPSGPGTQPPAAHQPPAHPKPRTACTPSY